MTSATPTAQHTQTSAFLHSISHASEVLRMMLPTGNINPALNDTHVLLDDLVSRVDLGRYFGCPRDVLTTEFLLDALHAASIPVVPVGSGKWAAIMPVEVIHHFSAQTTPKAEEIFPPTAGYRWHQILCG